MSKFEVVYNGYKLTDVMRITDVIRPIGNERNVLLNNNGLFGASVIGVSVGSKIIKVKFRLQGQNLEEVKHFLANIFNITVPARLTFSDEPDKYYLALIVGEVSLENVKWWLQKGEITFLIPDGVAHSTSYVSVPAPRTEGNKLVFDVTNNGTVPADPIIRVTHQAENGYLGFVCVEKNPSSSDVYHSLMELGTKKRFSAQPVQKSQSVLDLRNLETALSTAKQNQASVGGALNGRFALMTSNGYQRLGMTRAQSDRGETVGSLTWDIPQGSATVVSERLSWSQVFAFGMYSLSQCSLEMQVVDASGQFLYGVQTENKGGFDVCSLSLFVTDGSGGKRMLKTLSTSSPSLVRSSQGQNMASFPVSGGQLELTRNQLNVNLSFPGGEWAFHVPELEGLQASKVQMIIKVHSYYYVVEDLTIGLRSLSFRKDYVATPSQIPNRYAAGSELEINCERNRILVNGLDRLNDLVHGSDFLRFPPGESRLEVFCSDDVQELPRFEISFKERWI